MDGKGLSMLRCDWPELNVCSAIPSIISCSSNVMKPHWPVESTLLWMTVSAICLKIIVRGDHAISSNNSS